MIDVGIQDNIMITGVELRKDPKKDPMKDSLIISLEVQSDEKDLMGSLMGAEENVQDGNDQEYYFWPFDNKDKDNADVDLKEILKRIKDFKAQLNHILSNYMVKATIEAKWNTVIFDGTGVTPQTAEQMLIQPDIVNKVYKNIVLGFIALITPFIGNNATPSPLFRVKLIRQSKDKHFSRVPRFAPFWEPMTVLKAQSKLVYTKWEKENHFDSGTPSSDTPTPDSEPDVQDQKDVDDVFGLTDGDSRT